MTTVIDDAGDEDYTLLVTESAELEARKRIPYDGIRRYTTATRALPAGRRTESEFGLAVDEVLSRYLTRSATDASRSALAEGAARALRAANEGETANGGDGEQEAGADV